MKSVLSSIKSKRYVFTVYFVVMVLPVWMLSISAADIEDEVILFKDDSNLNISFAGYNVRNETGEVIDNLIMLLPNSTVTINIYQIPPSVKFVLLQTHSFLYNITLSYNKVLTQHMFMNGTDIGLVTILSLGQSRAQFFLRNDNVNSNATVLVAAQGYGIDAPVPGGCNMEFNVEIAATLSVSYTDALVRVENQAAATPLATPPPRSCEMSHVELELYHMYLPERDFTMATYFQAIRNMMTVDGVRENGRKVETSLEGSPMQRYYSSYPGMGTAYSVLAGTGSSSSAYVPAITYGCNIVYWTDRCEVLTTVFSKLFYAVVLFVGAFVCFAGHRFFKFEMFLLGFLVAGLISYIMLYRGGELDSSAIGGLSVIIGIAFGSIWVLFWCCFGLPMVSVSLATLSLGFLIASIIMNAGLADVMMFELDVNFWVVFSSITLSTAIISTTEIQKANILSCAVLGSFAVVVPVDHYVGGNVKYLLVNTLRRATVPNFRKAVIDPPFQDKDIILVTFWGALVILGLVCQLYQHHGRSPFPAPPCRNANDGRRQRLRPPRTTDRTPLLTDARQPYGSVSTGPDSVFETPDSVFETPTAPPRFTFLPKFPVGSQVRAANRELF